MQREEQDSGKPTIHCGTVGAAGRAARQRKSPDPNAVGGSPKASPSRPPGGHGKKSEPALTGLETSDVSFVRRSSRVLLLIANKLASDF